MSEKMNVIFFITDQQRADHLGCAGNPILKTPNLDRLASEGVTIIDTAESVKVTYPTFIKDFVKFGAEIKILEK